MVAKLVRDMRGLGCAMGIVFCDSSFFTFDSCFTALRITAESLFVHRRTIVSISGEVEASMYVIEGLTCFYAGDSE